MEWGPNSPGPSYILYLRVLFMARTNDLLFLNYADLLFRYSRSLLLQQNYDRIYRIVGYILYIRVPMVGSM